MEAALIPHFDGSISLGSIIATVVVLAGGGLAYVEFRTRTNLLLQVHKEVLASLTNSFHEHEKRDDELFRGIDARIADLSAGIQRLFERTGGDVSLFRREPRS